MASLLHTNPQPIFEGFYFASNENFKFMYLEWYLIS